MVAFAIKVAAMIFCIYVSVDSFRKRKLIAQDIKDELVNKKTGEYLRAKARRAGFLFALGAVASLVAFFFKLPFLGE